MEEIRLSDTWRDRDGQPNNISSRLEARKSPIGWDRYPLLRLTQS